MLRKFGKFYSKRGYVKGGCQSNHTLTKTSGAWLVLPTYMSDVFGSEMLQGLDIASGYVTQGEDNTKTLKAQ